MSWNKVRETIADYAPLAGSLLLPPAGGAVGTLIASVLGVKDEPDAVMEAIKNDPNAVLKVRQWEIENKTELQRIALAAETRRIEEETKQLQAVNETMLAEIKSDGKYKGGWRPLWGYASAIAFFEVIQLFIVITIKIVWTKDFELLAVVPQLVGAYVGLFGVSMAVVGVTAWHRGKRKRMQSGEVPALGLIGALASRLKKK